MPVDNGASEEVESGSCAAAVRSSSSREEQMVSCNAMAWTDEEEGCS